MSHNKLAKRLTRLENRQRRDATRLHNDVRKLEVWLFDVRAVATAAYVATLPEDKRPVAIKAPQSKTFGNGETIPDLSTDDLIRRIG